MVRAFTMLVKSLETGVRPGVIWAPVPVLLPGERTSTEDEPAASALVFSAMNSAYVKPFSSLGNTTGTGNKSDDVEGEEDDEGTVFDLSERLPGRSRKRRRTRLTTPLAASIAFPTPSLAAAMQPNAVGDAMRHQPTELCHGSQWVGYKAPHRCALQFCVVLCDMVAAIPWRAGCLATSALRIPYAAIS